MRKIKQTGKVSSKGRCESKEEKSRIDKVRRSVCGTFIIILDYESVILATDHWSVTSIESSLLPLLCKSVLGLLNSCPLGLLSVPLVSAASLSLTVDESTGKTSHQFLGLFVATGCAYSSMRLDHVSGQGG